MVSYCTVPTTGLPALSVKRLRQAMTHPGMQRVPTFPSRARMISRSFSPRSPAAPSNCPEEKLRVGSAPISLTAPTIEAVPYRCCDPLTPSLGLVIRAWANSLQAVRKSLSSCIRTALPSAFLMTTAFSPLLPMTAPKPPRAAWLLRWSRSPVAAIPAPDIRNSPA